jgi:DNA-binding transcriptional LysR family regulator
VLLLERTSHGARLTAAGEILLQEGGGALEAMAAATRRAQRAGQAHPQLILVIKPGGDGGLLPRILAEYESQPGAIPVEIVFSLGERAAMLRDGRADAGLMHVPQNDLTGLDAEELLTERQVAVLAETHQLAQRSSIRMADLAGETMPRWPGSMNPTGSGPLVQDVSQVMQLISLGRMVAVVPESVRGRLHPGLVCRPVHDAPTATIAVAWRHNSASRQIAALIRAATTAARHATPSQAELADTG